MAPAGGRAQVNVRDASVESSRGARRDPAPGCADGGGKSDVGLYADPRGLEERRASRRSFDDHADPEGAGSAAHAGVADLVAGVPARALGRDRRRGFLHDRGVDVARVRHLLHRLRDRSGLATRAHRGLDAASPRGVYAPSDANVDRRGRRVPGWSSRLDR